MSLRDGLWTQLEVVNALILRETRTRFGAHKLGYLWAIVDPCLMILTFFVLFNLGGKSAPFGMDLFGFIATGIIPYGLFSNSVTQVSNAIAGNGALLFYPHVQPLDLVIGRATLEFATQLAVFAVLMGASALVHQELHVADPLLVLYGFLLASLLGTGLGLVFCGLAQYSNVADRARGPLMRPFFWISGIFFAANYLPPSLRDHFMWNPLLHATEMVRAGWYESYDAIYVSTTYVWACILVLLLVGLSLERAVRRRIELT